MNCGKAQSVAVVFGLDSLLRECLFSQDGLPAVYLGWLLRRAKKDFTTKSFASDHELDFVVGKTLIEVKRYKRPRDISTLREQLSKATTQVAKSAQKAKESGIEVKGVYVATNHYHKLAALRDELAIKHAARLKGLELQLVGAEDFEDLIEAL